MKQTTGVFGRIRSAVVVTVCCGAAYGVGAQTGPNVFYVAKGAVGDCGPALMTMQGGAMPPPPGIVGAAPLQMRQFVDRSGESSKAGAPYSAVGTTETVQTLADGNHIVHTNTSHYYRDSSGRTRTELSLSAVGPFTLDESHTVVMITDPIAKQRFVLHPEQKRAEVLPFGPLALSTSTAGGTAAHGVGELSPTTASLGPAPVRCAPGVEPALGATVQLGQKTLAGLPASGTRTEHTIPAGQIGNEQPITVTSENWVSEELGVSVASTLHDPIIGDTQFHLSQIERAEPDASLFVVPSDYAVTNVTPNKAVIIQR